MASSKGTVNKWDYFSGLRHVAFALVGSAAAAALEVMQTGVFDRKAIYQAAIGAVIAGTLRFVQRWQSKIPTADEVIEKDRRG